MIRKFAVTSIAAAILTGGLSLTGCGGSVPDETQSAIDEVNQIREEQGAPQGRQVPRRLLEDDEGAQ